LGVKLVIFCKLFTTENRKKTLFSPKSYQQLFSPVSGGAVCLLFQGGVSATFAISPFFSAITKRALRTQK
jgi:hypothetical protein